jgi:hypothetical protein
MSKEYISKGILRICKYFLFFIVLSAPTRGNAQIELSSGIDMSYPLLLNSNNSNLYYNQLSFGIRVGLSYKPTNTQFFPTLYYSIGRTKLPLKQFEDNVSTLAFTYQNVILNGNFVITFNNNNSLYLIGGIGFSNLKEKFPDISGKNALQMSSHVDSTSNVNRIFPAMALGFEYVYGGAVNRNVYMSLGLTFQYTILFAEQNYYHITVIDAQGNAVPVSAYMSGNLITPNFNITLHYLLGKSIIFWQKKKSSFYL